MDHGELLELAQRAFGSVLTLVEALNPPAADETVIVKRGNDTREYDALALLAGTAIAPRLLATDESRLLVVMEDLPGDPLDALLQGDDRAAAEAGLIEFARVFGRMHRHTTLPGARMAIDTKRICALWEIDATDVVTVHADAFTQADVGPDGCMIATRGARLFDFEIAGPGAALTDVVMWRMGFPNCGAAAGAIPDALLRRMEQAYGPIDAEQYGHAYAYRLLERLDRYHDWKVREEDWVWGPASGRQRLLWMLRRCPESAPLAGEFAKLEERLRQEWRGTLPIYPALRDSSRSE